MARRRAWRSAFEKVPLSVREQQRYLDTVTADQHGATLWCGATCPGRMHDLTTVRIEGIDALLDAHPTVKLLVDAGYQGLARDHRDQVSAPPLKLRPGTPPERQTVWSTSANVSPRSGFWSSTPSRS